MRSNDKYHRADIVDEENKIVIEVQKTHLSRDKTLEREEFYADEMGNELVWIVHVEEVDFCICSGKYAILGCPDTWFTATMSTTYLDTDIGVYQYVQLLPPAQDGWLHLASQGQGVQVWTPWFMPHSPRSRETTAA
jgi:predicted amidohydrolase